MIRPLKSLVPLVFLALVAGCGGGGSADNGVAKLSATQALAKVSEATKAVKSVHIAGTIDQDGQKLALDVHAADKHGQGTLRINGGSLEVRLVAGTTYVRGSAETFTKLGAPAQQAQLLGDKWLKSGGSGGQFAAFSQFLDTSTLFDSLLKPQGSIKTGRTTTINGQQVFELVDESSGAGSLFISRTGKPLPVRIVKQGTGGGQVDFTDYDEDVNVTVPSGAVDLSQLGS